MVYDVGETIGSALFLMPKSLAFDALLSFLLKNISGANEGNQLDHKYKFLSDDEKAPARVTYSLLLYHDFNAIFLSTNKYQ